MNPDIIADNYALYQARLDMQDDIIKEAFFDFTKGKRNWQAICLSNYSVSDKKSAHDADGVRLPVKLKILDTLENIIPDPCDEGYSSEDKKKIISLFPLAYSDQPFENRYLLPSFGQVVKISFREKGPAELGRHRSIQYSFVKSQNAQKYVCNDGSYAGGTVSFMGNPAQRPLGSAPATGGSVGPPGAFGPPLKNKAWASTSATGLKGNEHFTDATMKKDYFGRRRKDRNKYDALIVKYSKIYNIDPNLIKAIIWKESGFRLKAQSGVGASGLTQVMPDTAKGINKILKYKSINLSDPDQAVHFGVYYIAKRINSVTKPRKKGTLVEQNSKVANVITGGTGYSPLELGLMAYNSGEGNLRKYGAKTVMSKKWDCKNKACGQTRKYVQKITAWHIWLTANYPL